MTLKWPRRGSGEQLRGLEPDDPVTRPCDLRYPHKGPGQDGPLFRSPSMDVKWNIDLFDGYLYISRSWTGEVIYKVKIDFEGEEARVSEIICPGGFFPEDPDFHIRAADFIIRSHLIGWPVPHPIPGLIKGNPKFLANFSWSHFGVYGYWGTYEDTTRIQPAPEFFEEDLPEEEDPDSGANRF